MNPLHKVVITGTGRAGTTFLVQLLTELGLDTGFTPEEARARVIPHCQAGLEHQLDPGRGTTAMRDWLRQPKHTLLNLVRHPPAGPYILKNPALCDSLGPALAEGRLVIDHAYIPVRDLEAAALSRVRVGGGNGNTPGGLWKTSDPRQQKAVLAEMFFNLVHTLTVYDVPHTFLQFPRLVEDCGYTHAKLSFLVGEIEPQRFRAAFARTARRELVHDYRCGGTPVSESTIVAPSPGPAHRAASVGALSALGGLWAGCRMAAWRSQGLFRLASWLMVFGLLGATHGGLGRRSVPAAQNRAVASTRSAPQAQEQIRRHWDGEGPPGSWAPYGPEYWRFRRLHHRWTPNPRFAPEMRWRPRDEQIVHL